MKNIIFLFTFLFFTISTYSFAYNVNINKTTNKIQITNNEHFNKELTQIQYFNNYFNSKKELKNLKQSQYKVHCSITTSDGSVYDAWGTGSTEAQALRRCARHLARFL